MLHSLILVPGHWALESVGYWTLDIQVRRVSKGTREAVCVKGGRGGDAHQPLRKPFNIRDSRQHVTKKHDDYTVASATPCLFIPCVSCLGHPACVFHASLALAIPLRFYLLPVSLLSDTYIAQYYTWHIIDNRLSPSGLYTANHVWMTNHSAIEWIHFRITSRKGRNIKQSLVFAH